MNLVNYRVKPGHAVDLDDWDPEDTSGCKQGKKTAEKELLRLKERLDQLQELLYAEHKHKLLVVLQGMDTSGKDGTIRHVFQGVNPQGVRVVRFQQPTRVELEHDYLWRVHLQTPAPGEMVIFNRSHYEDVLVVRVHELVPREVWKRRYQQICDFERMLTEEGTTILKFFLHISREEQKQRLEERLKDAEKRWKFDMTDVKERELWPQYAKAYETALEKTSTDWAPWHVVPANHKWYRNLVVSATIVQTLETLKMKYPKVSADLKDLQIK
ncbi:MAG: polyphosphate kinase 2 family protein [Acidobacteriales bacterium]|nr:polyphosphate kinase 2 family protein [Terriglobales bacterium]